MKQNLTLNKLLKIRSKTDKVGSILAALDLILLLVTNEVNMPVLDYVGIAILIISIGIVVAGTVMFNRNWRCPKCKSKLNAHRGIECCPDYCDNCGEKLDGNAPLKTKKG